MGQTRIEWADAVWNPITGCTPISEGCQNCYAKRMATRLRGRCGYPEDEPFRVTLHPERLEEPLKWKKPRRIFVCSMGDLFHPEVPDQFIAMVFGTMRYASHHTFMVLTKRPERMAAWFSQIWELPGEGYKRFGHERRPGGIEGYIVAEADRWPLPNVWIGVTAENQQRADERIPILLQIPAAVRFVSVEPMLGPLDLSKWLYCYVCANEGRYYNPVFDSFEDCPVCEGDRPMLDWVICGGETGPGARPMHPDWVRSLRDQCQEAGVPFFLKQLGEWAEIEADAIPRKGKPMCILLNSDGRSRGIEDAPFAEEIGTVVMCRVGKKLAGRLLDGRAWDEMPSQVVAP